MRILLSDGSGLTARQVATRLGRDGHTVEVLNPAGFALTRFTRWVHKVHDCPPFGQDPNIWFEVALDLLRKGRFDAVIATQEQVTVLSKRVSEIRALGVAIAVPPFSALEQLQDKLASHHTLAELGLPQPHGVVVETPDELIGAGIVPAFVKQPIGTASRGVRYIADAEALRRAALELAPAFDEGAGMLVQRPLDGPLLMVQAVFAQGRLVAWHANVREREGSGGGASSKRSMLPPVIASHLERLGGLLAWHGALSLDAILTADGPSVIDVNPRLVEPGNAWRAGVDLVGALLDATCDRAVVVRAPGEAGVRTHQLLLAVVKAAEQGRRGVLSELAGALLSSGPYRHSREELTPLAGDLRTILPIGLISTALLVNPKLADRLTRGAVQNYALSQKGWDELRAQRASPGDGPVY